MLWVYSEAAATVEIHGFGFWLLSYLCSAAVETETDYSEAAAATITAAAETYEHITVTN